MINEKAMLVAVHFSVWTARKHDKRVSDRVAAEYNAQSTAGRYNKKLLADAPKLDAVNNLVGRIRNWVYSVTLPWTDEGSRILPAELYYEFGKKWTEFETEFSLAVAEFLDAYDEYVANSEPVLGEMMCKADYLSKDKLREKFSMKRDILPFPTGGDFRIDLNQAERDRLAKELDEANKQTMAAGIQELWQRLYDVVRHMATSLGDPDRRLYSSTVDNVRDLADLLPMLNLAGDPTLTVLAQRVKEELCQHSADDLRRSPVTRQTVADNAARVAASIATEMGIAPESASALSPTSEELTDAGEDPDTEADEPAGPFLLPTPMPHDVQQQADDIMARMLPFMNLEIARPA